MLTELAEYRCKVEEEVKAMQSEKSKYTGNQQWREGNQDSNQQFGAEEINIQPEQNEETRIQKIEERLKNLQDNFKHSNIWIKGCPKEKRKSTKLKTYLKK